MTKRIFALLFIPVLIFCGSGCRSGSRLTYGEYSEKMAEAYELYYTKGLWGIVRMMIDKTADLTAVSPDIEDIFAGIEDAFAIIESISPPREFEKLHSELLDGMESERENMALRKKLLESATKEEYVENLHIIDEFEYALKLERDRDFSETFTLLHLQINDYLNIHEYY